MQYKRFSYTKQINLLNFYKISTYLECGKICKRVENELFIPEFVHEKKSSNFILWLP